MPQASDSARDEMARWFPKSLAPGISEDGPYEFLKARGWVLNKQWLWEPPARHHQANYYEYRCICFLIEEWDYGGIAYGTWKGLFNKDWR